MRIRTRRQYRLMAESAQRRVGKWIVVDIKPIEVGHSRLGIIVNRRFGNAVSRNRFKRIVREAFRLASPHFKAHFNLVVKSRTLALHAVKDHIQQELVRFISEICP